MAEATEMTLISTGWALPLNEPNVGIRRRDGGSKPIDPEATAPEPLMPLKEEVLRRIALHLFRLDLWSAQTVTEDMKTKDRLANIELHFKRLWISPPSTDCVEEWLDNSELYHSHGIMNLPKFHPYVTGMSYEQLEEIIKERGAPAKAMYIRLMLGRIWRLKDRNMIHDLARGDLMGSFQINLGLLIGERALDAGQYISKLTQKQSVAEKRLTSILNEARILRDEVTNAINQKILNEDLLPGLVIRLWALHEHDEEARKLLGVVEKLGPLLDPGREPWAVRAAEQARPLPQRPRGAPISTAFLASMTVLLLLIGSVPAWMSYTATAAGPGSWADNNFLSLVAGAILQILGLGTEIFGPLALPQTLYRVRLPDETKTLLWVFTTLTCSCTIGGVVLYGTISAQWSGVVAFIGQAMMGLVQLLFLFGT